MSKTENSENISILPNVPDVIDNEQDNVDKINEVKQRLDKVFELKPIFDFSTFRSPVFYVFLISLHIYLAVIVWWIFFSDYFPTMLNLSELRTNKNGDITFRNITIGNLSLDTLDKLDTWINDCRVHAICFSLFYTYLPLLFFVVEVDFSSYVTQPRIFLLIGLLSIPCYVTFPTRPIDDGLVSVHGSLGYTVIWIFAGIIFQCCMRELYLKTNRWTVPGWIFWTLSHPCLNYCLWTAFNLFLPASVFSTIIWSPHIDKITRQLLNSDVDFQAYDWVSIFRPFILFIALVAMLHLKSQQKYFKAHANRLSIRQIQLATREKKFDFEVDPHNDVTVVAVRQKQRHNLVTESSKCGQ